MKIGKTEEILLKYVYSNTPLEIIKLEIRNNLRWIARYKKTKDQLKNFKIIIDPDTFEADSLLTNYFIIDDKEISIASCFRELENKLDEEYQKIMPKLALAMILISNPGIAELSETIYRLKND